VSPENKTLIVLVLTVCVRELLRWREHRERRRGGKRTRRDDQNVRP